LIVNGRPFVPTTLTTAVGFGVVTVGAAAIVVGAALRREPTGFEVDAATIEPGATAGFVTTTGGAAAGFGFIASMAPPPAIAITATRAKIWIGRLMVRSTPTLYEA
jgi:hypothetical protein